MACVVGIPVATCALSEGNAKRMKKKPIPLIRIADAVAHYDGNQAALARELEVTRGAVSKWVQEGREHLPELQAHRLLMLNPITFNKLVEYR